MLPLAYFGSPSQWFIFAIVCLVVFGASRLPDVARNLGKSLGILKKARREFEEELMKAQEPAPAPKADASPEAEAKPIAHDASENKGDDAPTSQA